MPNFKMSIPHQLSQEEALGRIKALLGYLRAQHSGKISKLREDWNGYVGAFSGSAKGMAVSGTVTVTPSSIILEGTLPFAATFFKSRIESFIRTEAARLLM
jgi:hypothetical protein